MKVVDLNPVEWAHLVEAAPQSTVFHTNEWLAVIERTYQAEIRRLGFTDGNQLIGGIPLVLRKKFIYRLAGSPATHTMTPYQGFISLEPSDYGRLFEAFWNYNGLRNCDFIELTPPPCSIPSGWASSIGAVRRVERGTVYVDLSQGASEVFRAMDQPCRNKIRQSEKRGAVVTEIDPTGDEWVQGYYEMSLEVYRRRRRPPAFPRSLLENLRDVFKGSGKIRILLARYNDEAVAGGVFLLHRTTVYAWDGASRLEYYHLRANNLIHWTLIRWACSQGFHTYDMVGTAPNLPGIARFKEGFGGSMVRFPAFLQSRGPLAQLGEAAYRRFAPLARWVLSFLPRQA
jgi:CelD/BcsL family acetyltransferase involved in cellulose biosynthesis